MRKFVVLLMCLILPFSLFAQGAAESGAADAEGKVIIFQSKVEITEALERAMITAHSFLSVWQEMRFRQSSPLRQVRKQRCSLLTSHL